VYLLYSLVARYFGAVAGLVAGLALAVSPVSVAVNRDNNPDALFVLVLVASAYVGVRAVESGRLRTLLGAAVLVGLAFNTKMLAAAIVVPGIALAYLALAPTPLRRRLVHAALALLVLVTVSGAWIGAVDLTSAAARPYVGSTDDNSALSLVLGYNGLGRVTGQTGGTSFGGAGLGGAFSGSPGVLRLFNTALGDQGGWLIVLAVAGLLSAGIAAWRGRDRLRVAALLVLGGWFAAGAAVFSLSSGIIHTYYLSALAPAIAGLVGVGVVALRRDARRGSWWAVLPIVGFVGTALVQLDLLRRSGYLSWLQAVVILGALCAATVTGILAPRGAWPTAWMRRGATVWAAVATAALLAAPLAWSATTWRSAVNGVFPGAGPSYLASRGGVGGPGPGTSTELDSVLAYVKAHGATSRFALIVSSEQEAAPSVIRGEAVASMGGFTGRETVLTNAYLASLVRSGEARYFLLDGRGGPGGGGGVGGSNAAVSTVESTCTPVAAVGSLYDCAGQAAALAAAG
jgi:4-amino-4-deoxy-L-arabinose transferase-like glycosyltransferase